MSIYPKSQTPVTQAVLDAANARADRWKQRYEAALKEMNQRELHHFEVEQENADLLARADKAEAALDRVRELLVDIAHASPDRTDAFLREAIATASAPLEAS